MSRAISVPENALEHATRKLTAAAYQGLADVPPEFEWFANLGNGATRRAYQTALQDFIRFTGIEKPEEFRTVDFTKFCPMRQQLMSNCLCAVRFRPYSGHRSNLNDDSPAANALGAVPTTDGLPGRLEQTVLPGALAA